MHEVAAWAFLIGGAMLLLAGMLGRGRETGRRRLLRAAVGLCGIAAGGLRLLAG
ncbi:hypothetical protein [Streptomyces avicenniae]|uniref:hypothetical protein n=1 Tax=Streptomyces avicenniae TaxID=500153 RepID=UPI000A8DACF6|nr:hypothetical protein [Streptomyces avicenniae]